MSEIDTDKVYKQLKKQNGEAVARVIRDAVLLDVPNIVHILEFAGNDSEKIKALVPGIREIYKIQKESEYHTNKTPLELLSDAGYDAFVVTTEKQKNSIAKYFRPGEELCTFSDPHRHENYYMIHAVKRGADKIKPSDNPERQDEYGTSVISIQIAKTGGFISIKNRYNHTVNNPDATFSNNPDNIILGLSNSLKKYFNVEFNATENPLPDNYQIVNDQFVYYNQEQDNVYIGSNFYASGSTITKINTDYEIMLDTCILNTKNGQVRPIPGINYDESCVLKILSDVFAGKQIVVKKSVKNKDQRDIFADGVNIACVDKGQIIKLNLPDVKEIGDGFDGFPMLQEIKLPNVTDIGHGFLFYNESLVSFYAPNLKRIGDAFLHGNKALTELDLPNVTDIGHEFLQLNYSLVSFSAPNLKKVGKDFLHNNGVLTELNLPNVERIGHCFLYANNSLVSFSAPNLLELIGRAFLYNNEVLKELNVPNVERIGDQFLQHNYSLVSFSAPNLKRIGDDFLCRNQALTELNLPNVERIGDHFLQRNKTLVSFSAPNLLELIGNGFLHNNEVLTELNVPKSVLDNPEVRRLQYVVANNKLKKSNDSKSPVSWMAPNMEY